VQAFNQLVARSIRARPTNSLSSLRFIGASARHIRVPVIATDALIFSAEG